MSDSPYAPPTARVADRPPAAPVARPKQVTVAVALLWTSFVLGLTQSWLAGERDPELSFHPLMLTFEGLAFAFEAFVNVLVYRGRNWARIVAAVFAALEGLVLLIPWDETVPPGTLEQALTLLGFVLDIAAMYLLFSRPGASWFRPRE